MNNKKSILVLSILSLLFIQLNAQQTRTGRIEESLTTFNDVLRQLDMNYVDTLNYESITETAINQALRKVDPYTVYFPKKKDDDLRMLTTGKYGGIGAIIQQRDSQVIIANPYEGKPAQRNDVLSGDILLSVDGTSVKDKKVPDVSQLLRGEPGSIVKLELERNGQVINREFAREDIHMEPVDYYTVFPKDSTDNQFVGYISFREFTEGSAADFAKALNDLVTNHHIEGIIFDLRSNGGGIIEEAIRIVNNFVPKGTTVVSTKGKIQSANNTYITQAEPTYPNLPVVILVDKNSASASEIVSGSLQDLKRATLIGQRTFGKGLVQKPVEFGDGSMMRLTIARYYTPSDRCIQKPYTNGMDKNYEEDLMLRYQHGEFFSQDSIKHEGPEYHTNNGRVVYGGGGITPDIFVPEDTSDFTSYYKEASMSGLILQFGYDYTDQHRAVLKEYDSEASLLKYIKKQNLVEQFAQYAEKHGLKRRNLMIQRSRRLLEQYIYSRVIYNILDEQSWLQYLNEDDPAIRETLRVFEAGEAFPKAPDLKGSKAKKVAMSFDYRAVHKSSVVVARA